MPSFYTSVNDTGVYLLEDGNFFYKTDGLPPLAGSEKFSSMSETDEETPQPSKLPEAPKKPRRSVKFSTEPITVSSNCVFNASYEATFNGTILPYSTCENAIDSSPRSWWNIYSICGLMFTYPSRGWHLFRSALDLVSTLQVAFEEVGVSCLCRSPTNQHFYPNLSSDMIRTHCAENLAFANQWIFVRVSTFVGALRRHHQILFQPFGISISFIEKMG